MSDTNLVVHHIAPRTLVGESQDARCGLQCVVPVCTTKGPLCHPQQHRGRGFRGRHGQSVVVCQHGGNQLIGTVLPQRGWEGRCQWC